MNKNVIIAVVVVIILLLAGGAYMMLGKSKTATQGIYPQAAQNKPSNNVFSSIQDALSKSLSLQCSFTDESGRKIDSSIKSGAVRADITAVKPEDSGSVLMKDKKVYFWNAKMAIVMDMPDVTVAPGATGQTNQGASMLAAMEKYKQYCKPAVLSDSLFTPPADVKFQSMSDMMKGQMMPTGTSKMPAYPSGAVPTQYQQMMQQHQPPAGY